MEAGKKSESAGCRADGGRNRPDEERIAGLEEPASGQAVTNLDSHVLGVFYLGPLTLTRVERKYHHSLHFVCVRACICIYVYA